MKYEKGKDLVKKYSAFLQVAGFILLGCLAAPSRVLAQDSPGKGSQNPGIEKQKVSLDLESTSLYYGLKLLFTQVKCNFTINESLRALTVTAHFTDVPFRVALETLLKSTSTSLTYNVENGIYSVSVKVDEPPVRVEPGVNGPMNVTSDVARIDMIRIFNVSDLDIVQAFGGTIINIGLIPGFGGAASGQNRSAQQKGSGFFEGGENLIGTGHGSVIVVTPPAGAKP